MSLNSSATTDGSGVADCSDPGEVSEQSGGRIKSVASGALTRGKFAYEDLQADWRDATTGAKALMVAGAAAVVYGGVRTVMTLGNLRSRQSQSRLPWRR